ncbi:hypothetical protein QCD58_005016 [Enterobacter hormaechei]|nr:hypothetical protein [Enterobacter hormaechei]
MQWLGHKLVSWDAQDVPSVICVNKHTMLVYYADADNNLCCRTYLHVEDNEVNLVRKVSLSGVKCISPGGGVIQEFPYVAFQDPKLNTMRVIRWDGMTGVYDDDVSTDHVTSSLRPAVADILGTPTLVHQGGKYNGEMWYMTAMRKPGMLSWSADKMVPHTGMSGAPSILTMDGENFGYVFHEGSGDSGELWCHGYDGAQAWYGDTKVDIPYPIKSPQVVLYRGRPLLIWQGAPNYLFFAYLKRNVHTWSIDGSAILTERIYADSPLYGMSAAVEVYRERIYVYVRCKNEQVYMAWFGVPD